MKGEKNRQVRIGEAIAVILLFFGMMTMVAFSILPGILMLVVGFVFWYTEYTRARRASVPATLHVYRLTKEELEAIPDETCLEEE